MQKASLSLLILLACLAARPAHAGCSNPAGNEADQFYNATYHTYQFCNGANWMAMGAVGATVVGALTLISTQTASNSASLQWTGLGSTYNTLLLDCNGLKPATNSVNANIVFGEGATPTWESSNYLWAAFYFSGGASATNSNSASAMQLNFDSLSNSTTVAPFSFKAWIHNVGSSSVKKSLVGEAIYYGGGQYEGTIFYGVYSGDTNPITGIEVLMSSGNITSGQCSLYGLSS